MTPNPPSSSDGSALPPRHRPTLDNLSKDTTEMDLWAFDEELELEDDLDEEPVVEAPRTGNPSIPAPRERQGGASSRESDERPVSKTPTGGEDRIRMNVNKVRLKNRPAGPVAGQSKPESDFDELDHWEDTGLEPEIEELPVDPGLDIEVPVKLQPAVEDRPVARDEIRPAAVVPEVESPLAEDEFSAPAPRENATPVSLRPHLGLTKVERAGMIALLVILLLAAASILVFSLNRLPTESSGDHENDFPVKGSHLTVESAATYWRAPILDGASPDTVRRETRLLPVLEMKVSGGPAALRVLFRNDERTVVGDAVTRTVQGAGSLGIPATAGFDDLGMHAAYRTGETKPWTIEVFEAPSKETAGKDFKKLFEMNISTDRR